MADPAPTYQAHHLTAGRAVAWFVVVVALLGAADIVWSGEAGAYAGGLLIIGAVCLLSYDLGMRPAVLEEIDGVCVRNPLRTCLIPWASVTNVDVTDVLRVHSADQVVRCFAVPRRRPRPHRPALGLGRPPSEFGFPEPPGMPGPKARRVEPPVSRADMVASRLRSQADAAARAAAQGSASVRLAPDALWSLAAAGVLLVLAVLF